MAQAYSKAYFERLGPDLNVVDRFEVQFNPTEFALTKAAQIAEIAIPGIDNPILQFVRGQNERITLELFFDTTEAGTHAGARPVTTLTNKFYALVKMSGEEHAPPRCRFGWGEEFPGLNNEAGKLQARRTAFECIVESVQQTFTLFSPDGVPLRARLSVTLREYVTLETQLKQLNLQTADHTRVHVVQRGETLPQIAYKAYKDPAHWRLIATANRLLHPRNLQPGMVLELPPLRT